MSEVILDKPIDYQWHQGFLEVKHEEDALCWFWAFPQLMPWPHPIIWLYTPVVGNSNWPGDLWGIDSQGELLVAECKQCRHSGDPFADFVKYQLSEPQAKLSAAHWQKKFLKHLKAELRYPDCLTERPKGRTDGILPRSNKRKHIRRWPKLGHIIDNHIRDKKYREGALNYLQVRMIRNDPPPFYLAIMVVSDPKVHFMTEKAIASSHKLQRMVGNDHVRVVTVQAAFLSHTQVCVSAH